MILNAINEIDSSVGEQVNLLVLSALIVRIGSERFLNCDNELIETKVD